MEINGDKVADTLVAVVDSHENWRNLSHKLVKKNKALSEELEAYKSGKSSSVICNDKLISALNRCAEVLAVSKEDFKNLK